MAEFIGFKLIKMEIKRLDFKQGTFVANGNKYYITNQIAIGRKKMLDQIKVKIGTGMDVGELFKYMSALDKELIADRSPIHNLAQARQLNLNAMHNLKALIEGDTDVFLQFCGLFINKEDEDVKTITKELIDEKIDDWTQEGFAYEDFFLFAINSVNGLQNHLIELKSRMLEMKTGQNLFSQ